MLIVDILEHRGRRESPSAVDGVLRCRSAGTVQTGMAGLLAQFRQVWRCHVVQTRVDHAAESERDALGDVEPMNVVTTNVCQSTV